MQEYADRAESYEEQRKKVSRFHLTSDIFFCKVMEDTKACQEVIRILTGESLVVKNVRVQYSIRNLENRSVVLDVLAEDELGRLVNVEMHPQEDEDHIRRVRFHLSSIDMSFLEKGTKFDEIPEVYLIYITEKDFIGLNKGINKVVRTISGSKKVPDNGVHELYVNLGGKTRKKDQRELLNYMANSESNYKTGRFPNLVERVRFFKEKKEGVRIMCKIIEKEREEAKAEGMAEGRVKALISQIRKKYQKQNTPEQAAEALELDVQYVKRIMDYLKSDSEQSDDTIAGLLLQENS